jgi:hypothetical protein
MTKKMMQKKSKTKSQAAKAETDINAVKATAAAEQQVHAVSEALPAVKKDVVADVKPAVSGREAARLALVQKVASSKWASLYSKANKIAANPYNLKNQYEVETAILHKTLGWGYIQDKKNDRLEVLFENGIKYLISNYK